jgi:membrane-bound lytic murein transglycosylase B
MSDQAARRERRITVAIAAAVLCAVTGLVVAAGLLLGSPPGRPPTEARPTTTMKPVKPVAEPLAPTSAPTSAPASPSAPASASASPSAPTSAPASASAPSGDRIAAAWLARVSRQTGIGRVALEAYALASLRLAREQPGCHLGWTTLAGIGAIESGHGTNGGARLRPDGTTTRRILGPALDGTSGTARIPSTEQSQKWHGDPRWDHAVGPMQFIPSTWRKWGSDASSDGTSDPNNIDDAAYAAGRYLCGSGQDLRTGEGWTQAVFSYNHSPEYVRSVVARANSYARP